MVRRARIGSLPNRIATTFLIAVLENNLTGALRAADSASRKGLVDIMLYLWNEVPSSCWGSPAKVKAWLSGEHD